MNKNKNYFKAKICLYVSAAGSPELSIEAALTVMTNELHP